MVWSGCQCPLLQAANMTTRNLRHHHCHHHKLNVRHQLREPMMMMNARWWWRRWPHGSTLPYSWRPPSGWFKEATRMPPSCWLEVPLRSAMVSSSLLHIKYTLYTLQRLLVNKKEHCWWWFSFFFVLIIETEGQALIFTASDREQYEHFYVKLLLQDGHEQDALFMCLNLFRARYTHTHTHDHTHPQTTHPHHKINNKKRFHLM